MKGKLYIDGLDAYAVWGVYVVQGGWNDAISYPPLKAVEANDWHEEDGIEVDLSDPKLNCCELSINFAWRGEFTDVYRFVEQLSDDAYHEFDCPAIKRKFTLRMTQMPNLSHVQTLGFVTLKFSNDFPLKDYVYQPPVSSIAEVPDYFIGDVPFTDYGCRILQGALAEVIKTPAVKQNLLRNIATRSGATYDGERVTFKSKDIKLNCLMRAATLDELWRNYDALLYDLVRPNERQLGVAALKQNFACHYKSAKVSEFFPTGKIWLAFTLTLTMTQSTRIEGDDGILATEDGDIVITEDGLHTIIIDPRADVAATKDAIP